MFLVESDYASYNRLISQLERLGYEQRDPEFGETVRWHVGAPDQNVELLHQRIMDLSSGDAMMTPAGTVWLEDRLSGDQAEPI
jgi:hypothetical protein